MPLTKQPRRAQPPGNADPFGLDRTPFARKLRRYHEWCIAGFQGKQPPMEGAHPLRSDPVVSALVRYLEERTEALDRAGRGGTYFRFNEGYELRPEVIARLTLDYIRAHPEILRPPAKRRKKQKRSA